MHMWEVAGCAVMLLQSQFNGVRDLQRMYPGVHVFAGFGCAQFVTVHVPIGEPLSRVLDVWSSTRPSIYSRGMSEH